MIYRHETKYSSINPLVVQFIKLFLFRSRVDNYIPKFLTGSCAECELEVKQEQEVNPDRSKRAKQSERKRLESVLPCDNVSRRVASAFLQLVSLNRESL